MPHYDIGMVQPGADDDVAATRLQDVQGKANALLLSTDEIIATWLDAPSGARLRAADNIIMSDLVPVWAVWKPGPAGARKVAG